MTGLIALRIPIVSVLFQSRAFDYRATLGTAEALLFYSVGLWAFAGTRVTGPDLLCPAGHKDACQGRSHSGCRQYYPLPHPDGAAKAWGVGACHVRGGHGQSFLPDMGAQKEDGEDQYD